MEEDKSTELFTTQMRKATRKVHKISDALVNGKLIVGLSNNAVWADGLLVFYEIFYYLEYQMHKHKKENLGKLLIQGMERKDAFEEDLAFYLGADWKKDHVIREPVIKYLKYLDSLKRTDPDLLMPFVYHLYMGLFSGGQILRKKRSMGRMFGSAKSAPGEAVTNFGDNVKISDLKQELKRRMNEIAESLSDEKKARLVEESLHVFEWNNTIIESVRGTNQVLLNKLCICLAALMLSYCLYKYLH